MNVTMQGNLLHIICSSLKNVPFKLSVLWYRADVAELRGSTSIGSMALMPYQWRSTSKWVASRSSFGAGPISWKKRWTRWLARCQRQRHFKGFVSNFRCWDFMGLEYLEWSWIIRLCFWMFCVTSCQRSNKIQSFYVAFWTEQRRAALPRHPSVSLIFIVLDPDWRISRFKSFPVAIVENQRYCLSFECQLRASWQVCFSNVLAPSCGAPTSVKNYFNRLDYPGPEEREVHLWWPLQIYPHGARDRDLTWAKTWGARDSARTTEIGSQNLKVGDGSASRKAERASREAEQAMQLWETRVSLKWRVGPTCQCLDQRGFKPALVSRFWMILAFLGWPLNLLASMCFAVTGENLIPPKMASNSIGFFPWFST